MLIWKRLTEVNQCLPLKLLLSLAFSSGPSRLKYVRLCFPFPVVLWVAVSFVECAVNHYFLRPPVWLYHSTKQIIISPLTGTSHPPPTCSPSPDLSSGDLANHGITRGISLNPRGAVSCLLGFPLSQKPVGAVTMKYTSQLNSPYQTSRSRSKCYGENTSIFESNF